MKKKEKQFTHLNLAGWDFYFTRLLAENKSSGKWMYFFDKYNFEKAENLVKEAVSSGICREAKHTDKETLEILNSGVCCFYCRATNEKEMKRIIKFFLDNGMIQRTKSGKYYNISFKYNTQTEKREYNSNFVAEIKLSDYIDLYTGEFIK